MSTPRSVLTRPLTVYQLPPELLAGLSVRSIQAPPSTPSTEPAASAGPSRKQHTVAPSPAYQGEFGCQTCPGASFETPEEQRAHFKSDWHRYNIKAKLKGQVVTAEQWEQMIEGVSSISGSASSSDSDASGSSQSRVARLLSRQKLNGNGNGQPHHDSSSDEAAELADQQRRAHLRTAVIWFSPTTALDALGVPKDTQFGVHRSLFPQYESAADYLAALRTMQLRETPGVEGEERRITMLMVAGGHFAGMVVGLRALGKGEKQLVKGAGEIRIIQHKTFHRYTTRKKQGGSQGLNDNAKSKAISAGAMLRRYGEQALQEEIRELLKEWEEDLQLSERIFLRASTHGRRSFWGYDGAVLDKGDTRIRTFPFPTRRPTQQELLRCWHELVRVKVSHLTEEALREMDDAYIASLKPKQQVIKPTPAAPVPAAPAVPKLSAEEETRLERRRRLEEMVRKGRLEALKPFWDKYSTEFDASVLGLAASSGQEEVLRWMMEEVRLDPTTSIDGKRAYDLALTKGVRNVFRRTAYDHPEWYDWKEAHVPSGLSEEQEAAQDEKKKEHRKGLRDKMKEKQAARAEADKEKEKSEPQLDLPAGPAGLVGQAMQGKTGPQKLGGRGAEGGLAGLSAEMRMQIERERRARAAEARFKRAAAITASFQPVLSCEWGTLRFNSLELKAFFPPPPPWQTRSQPGADVKHLDNSRTKLTPSHLHDQQLETGPPDLLAPLINSALPPAVYRMPRAAAKLRLLPRMPKTKPAFYAVQAGRKTGVFTTWPEAQAAVTGFAGAKHKKFPTLEQAEAYLGYKAGAEPYLVSAAPTSSISSTSRVVPAQVPMTELLSGMRSEASRPESSGRALRPTSPVRDAPSTSLAGTFGQLAQEGYNFTPPPHRLIVYADGSGLSNGSKDALAGSGVFWGSSGRAAKYNIAARVPGPKQTNNRGELYALILALERCPHPGLPLEMRSDSQYSIAAVTQWLPKWARNGFKTAAGRGGAKEDVKNVDMIKHLAALLAQRGKDNRVTFKYVKAHVNIAGNEAADRLAKQGAMMPSVRDRTDWLDPDRIGPRTGTHAAGNEVDVAASLEDVIQIDEDCFLSPEEVEELEKELQQMDGVSLSA